MSVIEAMARAGCPGIGDVVKMMIATGEIAPSSGPIHYDTLLQSALNSMRAALGEARKMGWQLVPVEPDVEMVRRAVWADDKRTGAETCKHLYRAMLAAAPSVEDA